jgi:hypothetical protein
MRREDTGMTASTEQQLQAATAALSQMQQLMLGMADAIRAANTRMEKMERQLELLTPITGAQERALRAEIRRRAEALSGLYRLPDGSRTAIAAAIRAGLKGEAGVRAMRELPRIEYSVLLERVALWDDYDTMRAIRKRARDGG